MSTAWWFGREEGMNSLARSLSAFALLLVACGPAASQRTVQLDARGGTLALESGTSLAVPAGALSKSVEVTLRETHSGDDVTLEVEPRGLELERPADVSWSDDGRVAENESGEHVETERREGREHHSMSRLGTVRRRGPGHDDGADAGQSRGRETETGHDRGVDADAGRDDHGSSNDAGLEDRRDAGFDDHGRAADAGVDGGDDSGHHGGR